MAVVIVIIVVLLVGATTVLLTARRSATTGGLSRETRRRDTGEVAAAEPAPATTPSTDLELQGRERADETRARAGGAVAERPSGGVTRWEPVDEEELGVTRRQFLNRG